MRLELSMTCWKWLRRGLGDRIASAGSFGDEGLDTVDDALQAELEGAGWVVGGAVLGACGGTYADCCRVAGRVEDGVEQGAVSLPPLLVRDAGAGQGFGC